MKQFYDTLSVTLGKIIVEAFEIHLAPPLWELPQRIGHGDLSSMAAMRLARAVKKSPLEIAEILKPLLEAELGNTCAKIEIVKPGFLNIFFSQSFLIECLNDILERSGDFFRPAIEKNILIEFLSANPTGPLSIAHGRQAIVGDAIASILEFCGAKVTREYYLNDAGRQIELFEKSLKVRRKQLDGEDAQLPEGGYKGEYVKNIAAELIGKNESEFLQYGLSSMIALIKNDLQALGVVEFDDWFSQRALIDEGKVEAVFAALKKKDLIYEKDGALWFRATKYGDDKDRVVKKADGELTYFASDIAYHQDKCSRGFDTLINLWGPDHHGYIKRVKTAIEAFGYSPESLEVLIIQLVTLKTKERMSKRAGTFILLKDLIDDVGKDAARFYYLSRKNSSHLEFDIDLAKATSFDNPLYYIQYVCARIESIFRKAPLMVRDSKYSQKLKSDEELLLLRELLKFSHILGKAAQSREPVFIIEYLKSLAQGFHKFYERVRVIDDDESLTQARLNLLSAVRCVFHSGLHILGITPVEKM